MFTRIIIVIVIVFIIFIIKSLLILGCLQQFQLKTQLSRIIQNLLLFRIWRSANNNTLTLTTGKQPENHNILTLFESIKELRFYSVCINLESHCKKSHLSTYKEPEFQRETILFKVRQGKRLTYLLQRTGRGHNHHTNEAPKL